MRQALAELDDLVEMAIASGDASDLDIIGYGEISTVLRLTTETASLAVKRLPPFPPGTFDRYSRVFHMYLERLKALGATPVDSWLESFDRADTTTVYCIQPMQYRLLVDRLATADEPTVARYAAHLVSIVTRTVGPTVGLDAQVSNWAINPDDQLVYMDVTTPLMRDGAGEELLDTDLFIASLPAALRPGVERFLLEEILGHYYDHRSALLDLVGNLKKEKLDHTVTPFLDEVNAVVEPAITSREIHRYYRSDALMWEVLQRLRRTDRWWQQKIRRRSYPFILPGRIER